MLGLAGVFDCDYRQTGRVMAASAQVARDRWIPTLDGWRAVAVMMVVVSHELVSKPGINDSIERVVSRLGPLGVQIFFAISGYLICTLLLLESDKRPISLRAFYTRRVFRILPPAFTYLAIVGLLSIAGFITVRAVDIASCVFLFANYIHNGWYVAHFWSLSVEEHFYLLWPAVLAFAGWRRASHIAVAGIAAVGSWRLYSGATQYFGTETAWLRTDMVLDAFFAPCLLAIALHHFPGFKVAVQRLSIPLTTIALSALLVLATVAGLDLSVKKSLQAVLLPLIVVSTVLRPATWIGWILEHPAMRWIGRISYSLYLWQQMFSGPFHSWSTMPFRLAALFAVAAASYYFIERPTMAYGRSLLRRDGAKSITKTVIVKA
jgi:peptidoglycan/LPS O-acetylase OafA/YrhL